MLWINWQAGVWPIQLTAWDIWKKCAPPWLYPIIPHHPPPILQPSPTRHCLTSMDRFSICVLSVRPEFKESSWKSMIQIFKFRNRRRSLMGWWATPYCHYAWLYDNVTKVVLTLWVQTLQVTPQELVEIWERCRLRIVADCESNWR